MAREDLHFRLRIPDELKRRIETEAESRRRSMTAEIVARLQESFEEKAQSKESAEEIIQLKEQVAFYKGINESLSNTLKLFLGRLTALEGGTSAILEEILKDELGLRPRDENNE